MKNHHYSVTVEWTGNEGKGTLNYKSYNRDHTIKGHEKYNEILASSDPSFLGDKTKYNPEDLFVSSVSACHMLWYLHLCSTHKIIVIDYKDNATGIMETSQNGSGQFKSITLNPVVVIRDKKQIQKAIALHKEANAMCFIANSCNFVINHQPKIIIETE